MNNIHTKASQFKYYSSDHDESTYIAKLKVLFDEYIIIMSFY